MMFKWLHKKTEDTEVEQQELLIDRAFLTAAASIPGYQALRHLGFVSGIADYAEGAIRSSTVCQNAEGAFAQALRGLTYAAHRIDANAVVNLRLSTGGFQRSGAGFQSHVLTMTGDAIWVEAMPENFPSRETLLTSAL